MRNEEYWIWFWNRYEWVLEETPIKRFFQILRLNGDI